MGDTASVLVFSLSLLLMGWFSSLRFRLTGAVVSRVDQSVRLSGSASQIEPGSAAVGSGCVVGCFRSGPDPSACIGQRRVGRVVPQLCGS